MSKKHNAKNNYKSSRTRKNNSMLKHGVIITSGIILIIVIIAVIFPQNGVNTNKGHSHFDTKGGMYYHSDAEIIKDVDLTIDKSEAASNAKFYPYMVGNVDMEVLAVKLDDGTVKAALNTCLSCYNSGRGYFEQKGDQLVCQNCGRPFNINNVGSQIGECYPLIIPDGDLTENEDNIVISKTFLASQKDMFLNWRR